MIIKHDESENPNMSCNTSGRYANNTILASYGVDPATLVDVA